MCLARVLSLCEGSWWWCVSCWDGQASSTAEGSLVCPIGLMDLGLSLHSGRLMVWGWCPVGWHLWFWRGQRKRSCFAVLLRSKPSIAMLHLQSQNQRWSAAGFALELGLCSTRDPVIRGFIPFQVVVLVTVGFFSYIFCCKAELNTPCLKLTKQERFCLQSVTLNTKLCNSLFLHLSPSSPQRVVPVPIFLCPCSL